MLEKGLIKAEGMADAVSNNDNKSNILPPTRRRCYKRERLAYGPQMNMSKSKCMASSWHRRITVATVGGGQLELVD